jgi:hypothetical protein
MKRISRFAIFGLIIAICLIIFKESNIAKIIALLAVIVFVFILNNFGIYNKKM